MLKGWIALSYQFICYPKCTTCQRARRWLMEHDVPFAERDIKSDHPTAGELESWYRESGLPLKKFFNTSGLLYKSLALREKLPGMDEQEQLALLATDGMLVRRPILVGKETVLVGFREEEWERRLGKGESSDGNAV